jgi:hypothetical protein
VIDEFVASSVLFVVGSGVDSEEISRRVSSSASSVNRF